MDVRTTIRGFPTRFQFPDAHVEVERELLFDIPLRVEAKESAEPSTLGHRDAPG